MFKARDCDKPVHPSDTTQFFKQKPSIWSAVYRRDFLERNGIKFLPTPGASFQDTSFAFKAIACADKAVYLHDAVLSYRQDNENSSVNSSAKVFCVNTEYAEIERWIREDYARDHTSDDVARMLKFNQLIKYDSYMWNYVRLAPKFYKEFLVQMAKEFQAALDAGEFSLDDLKPWKRANLAAILKDPEGWVDEHPHLQRMVPWGALSITPRLEAWCGRRLPHRIAEGVGRYGRGLDSQSDYCRSRIQLRALHSEMPRLAAGTV